MCYNFTSHWISIVFVLLVEIFNPHLEVTVSSLCIGICSASSESDTITWSSTNKSVLISLFLENLIPFMSSDFHSVILIYICVKFGEKGGRLLELFY
jgi:hypothetical protein